MKKIFLTCLFIVSMNSAGFCQTKIQDIQKLLEITGARQQAEQMFDLMLPSLVSIAPGAPSAFWTLFRSKLDINGLVNLIVPLYDKHFSHEDIKNLIQFYESPIGKKLLEVTPLISQESYSVGEIWGQRLANEIISELRKQGYF